MDIAELNDGLVIEINMSSASVYAETLARLLFSGSSGARNVGSCKGLA